MVAVVAEESSTGILFPPGGRGKACLVFGESRGRVEGMSSNGNLVSGKIISSLPQALSSLEMERLGLLLALLSPGGL